MPARNRSIDAFRGLSIILMVFFTVIRLLSDNLPFLLNHNVRDAAHTGDFVLPMFLFASGLSIAYFLESRKHLTPPAFRKDIASRFLKLAAVGIILSPYSTRGFLEMDEVMLSALLFVTCIALSRLDWRPILMIIFVINTSYLFINEAGWTGEFENYYLGGYLAAIYYLPVMLVGMLIGKGIISRNLLSRENRIILMAVTLMFFISYSYTSVDKLSATPSFMMLSILVCFLLYYLVDLIVSKIGSIKELESPGRKPFRYWIMMYAFFIIPLKLWIESTGETLPLDFQWPLAIVVSILFMIILWMVSKILDYLDLKYKIIDKETMDRKEDTQETMERKEGT